MKTGKKILGLMLAVLMCISVVPITDLGIEVSALTWGDYEYAVLDDGTIEIADYSGSATELTLPSEIDGKAVTRIGVRAFARCDTVKSVIIPKGVTHISRQAFYGCANLANITIPDSVTNIGTLVFDDSMYYNNEDNWTDGLLIVNGWVVGFKTDYVYIPANVKALVEDVFYTDLPAIKYFEVDSNNKYYSADEYGVLYNKDKTKLICYPNASKNKAYTIPETVETIVMLHSLYLENLIITDSVKEILDYNIVSLSFKNVYIYNDDIGFNTQQGFCYFGIDQDKFFEVRDEYGKLCEEYVTKYINGTLTEEYMNEFMTKFEEIESYFLLEDEVPFGIIHANEGSTAQAYANKYGINFKLLESHTHTYGEWYTVTEATVFAEGTKRRDCDCGEYETETITKLENVVAEDTATGVEITYTGDNFDSAVEIVVSEDVVNANIAFEDEYENYKSYDISLEINGEKVQPDGFVTVKLPLPEGYNADTTVVYYVDNSGEKTLIDSTVENGYVIFETDHFSEYVIVDESSKIHKHSYTAVTVNPTCTEQGSTTYTCSCGDSYIATIEATGHTFDGSECVNCDYDKADECDCRCHDDSFFAKILWKITNFFNKLFKKNAICSCGIAHY